MPFTPLLLQHNVAPLGRDARKKTRDMVEKAALKARVGSFERHGSEIDAPLVQPVRTSQMFLSDVDRFRQQSADAELRKARELQRQRHDVLVENKRERVSSTCMSARVFPFSDKTQTNWSDTHATLLSFPFLSFRTLSAKRLGGKRWSSRRRSRWRPA